MTVPPVLRRTKPFLWPLVIVLLATTGYAILRHKRDLVDFAVYRTAAERALSAQPLYRPEDGHYQYKYLPAFALAMAPFAWPPPEVARAAWFALSIALLAIFVRQVLRALPARRMPERRLRWLTLLLLGKCYVKELAFGQTNLLFGIVLFSAVTSAQRRRPIAAGAMVAVAVFVKPYALLLLPWLAVSQGVTALCVFAVGLCTGLALPAVVYGWHGNLALIADWYRTVTETTAPNLLLPENISIPTMWAKWLGVGPAASTLAAATSLAALAVAGAVLWRRKAITEPDYLEAGLLMLLVPLVSPQGWDYVLLLGTPAVVCLVDRLRDVSTSWRSATVLALALVAFTIFDLMGRRLYSELMLMSVETLAGLTLVACLAHLRWRALA